MVQKSDGIWQDNLSILFDVMSHLDNNKNPTHVLFESSFKVETFLTEKQHFETCHERLSRS